MIDQSAATNSMIQKLMEADKFEAEKEYALKIIQVLFFLFVFAVGFSQTSFISAPTREGEIWVDEVPRDAKSIL